MVSFKYFFIASIYFIGFQLSNAGDTIACTAGGNECQGTTKCFDTGAGALFCREQCTSDADCGGTASACAAGQDVDGNTVKFCPFVAKECTKDAECTTDPALTICNLLSFTCIADPAAATTTLATTTLAPTTTAAVKVTVKPSTPTCADQVVGGSNDCASLAAYCTNSVYLSLMKEKCPKTCGYCTTTGSSGSGSGSSGSGGCVDKVVGGSSDCASMAAYCKNTIYKSLMMDQCPKTCGYCTSSGSSTSTGTSSGGTSTSTCKDASSNCSKNVGLCQTAIYKDLMKTNCASTCGYC